MYDSLQTALTSPWLYYVLMGIYVFTIVVTLGVVISENRNPVKSLAWVTVLLTLPLIGIILYMFFGRSIKNTRMITRRNRKKLKRLERGHQVDIRRLPLSDESKSQIKLGRSLTGSFYYPDNEVVTFTSGKAKFDALMDDLRNAKSSISLQYYIFEDDKIGRQIADILMQKARQGVAVRVIYDHVGSFHVRKKFFKKMREAGVLVYPFFKVNFPLLGYRLNWRNHRKLVVIDGKIGYIGGMNIADRYIDGGKFNHWRDTHLRITGPGVAALQYSFGVDWNFMGQPVLENEHIEPDTRDDNNKVGIQLITSGPTNQWSNIELMFHRAISNARERVYVQTPYFLPTEGLLKALVAVAMANIDVRIMIPMHPDSAILRYASFSYVTECLRAGIKIYLYKPGMLHSKVMIVDNELASIGSTNFDFRSFEHNFEANLFVFSREFNEKQAEIFLNDQRLCERVLPNQWRKRPLLKKWAESILRLLSPIL
ncbi:MAG: cardiolipin synthase [Muribaculaceae bacterium]|nr:cardiolipin synthase [Muribaculaceae bacterium]